MTQNRLQRVLDRVYEADVPCTDDLIELLSLKGDADKQLLYDYADQVRSKHVGDGILMRGIIEFSSYCRNACLYCGLNEKNKSLERYRLTKEEILDAMGPLIDSGIRTVVLQSGEDDELKADWLADVVTEIKKLGDIAITLSVGEWPAEDYKLWRDAGADRFLLKIETSNRKLYDKFHPDMSYDQRIRSLEELRGLGYQLGSGTLVGLKGQAAEHLAEDVLLYQRLQCDMIGIGLFIPHKQTELGEDSRGDLDMTLKMLAVTRIVTKDTHLPATTATGSLGDGDNRIDALKAGANVIMPNYTPQPYRQMYEIYPNKRCIDEKPGMCNKCIEMMAKGLGRYVDYSRGDSLKMQ